MDAALSPLSWQPPRSRWGYLKATMRRWRYADVPGGPAVIGFLLLTGIGLLSLAGRHGAAGAEPAGVICRSVQAPVDGALLARSTAAWAALTAGGRVYPGVLRPGPDPSSRVVSFSGVELPLPSGRSGEVWQMTITVRLADGSTMRREMAAGGVSLVDGAHRCSIGPINLDAAEHALAPVSLTSFSRGRNLPHM